MEPLKEEGMKIEITELPWPQELCETLDYLIKLVFDSRSTASKAYEVSQLMPLPGIYFLCYLTIIVQIVHILIKVPTHYNYFLDGNF